MRLTLTFFIFVLFLVAYVAQPRSQSRYEDTPDDRYYRPDSRGEPKSLNPRDFRPQYRDRPRDHRLPSRDRICYDDPYTGNVICKRAQ